MLITLSRRTAICQSVAEVYLTGMASWGALSHRFNFFKFNFIIIIIIIIIVIIIVLLIGKSMNMDTENMFFFLMFS